MTHQESYGIIQRRKQVEVKNDYLKLDIQLFADGEITYKVTLDSDGAIKSMGKIEKAAVKT